MWHLSDNDIRYLERGWPDDDDDVSEPLSRDSFWITKDKQRVRVCDMRDSHLMNTLVMLCGKSPIGTVWHGDNPREWLEVMAVEAVRRGLIKRQLLLPQIDRLLASGELEKLT